MRRGLTASTLALLCAGLLAACGGSGSTSTSGGGASASTSTSTTSSAAASNSGTASSNSGNSGAGTSTAGNSGSGAKLGFEGVPLETGPALAPASTTGTGVVDGISCASAEQLAYHIHAHLVVFENGQMHQLPGGIGIPGSHIVDTAQGPVAAGGSCIYWLHTHAPDGIIHIESPTKKIYTLGNFFDEWRQPLGSRQVASLHGTVSAFVDGTPWKKDPRDIPLRSHADIQLDIGQPIPPIVKIDWSQTQL